MSTDLDPGHRRSRPAQRWCARLLLAAVLVLTACADEATVAEPAEPSASALPSTEPTASAAPSTGSTTATGTPPPDPIASPTPSDDYQYTNFVTPTGNIRCSIASGPEGDGVRCDIGDKQWESPPAPEDCEFDWGSSLSLDEEQSGFACVSDAIDDGERLPYGATATLGSAECTSRETGVRCEHVGSGHGFELSRARYSLF